MKYQARVHGNFGMEDYDPAYYEAIEQRHAEEVARDEANIGEIDESLKLDFCDGCPLLTFPQEDIVQKWYGTGVTAGVQGLQITLQFESRSGAHSKEILLGTHGSNSIGSKRQAKIYEEAAKKTIACTGPDRVPRFLGPFAMKRCGALREVKHL